MIGHCIPEKKRVFNGRMQFKVIVNQILEGLNFLGYRKRKVGRKFQSLLQIVFEIENLTK